MKKLIFLTIFALTSASAFAQDIEFGAKAGLNLATQPKIPNNNMRPGLYAGMFADYTFNDFVGLQSELLYSMIGTNYSYDNFSGSYKTDYIVLPVLVKLYVAKRLSLDLGPQFGYMVSDKRKYIITDFYYKKFDVSFGMGFSCKITNKFDLTGRYYLGLTKIMKDSGTRSDIKCLTGTCDYVRFNSDIYEDIRNSVIQFGISYRF